MDVLLTGGTGYIGSAVLGLLLESGHGVTAVVRSDEAAARVEQAGATAAVGDVADHAWLVERLRGSEGAIHTASPGGAASPAFDRAVVEAVVEAYDDTSKPYVHTSGLWIYGSGTDLSEDGPLSPPDLTAWRPAVEAEVLGSDLVASIVVPTYVYGHRGGLPEQLVVNAPRDGSGRIVLVGSGEQHWAVVHVDDLAALYVSVLESGRAFGRVLAASPERVTLRDLAEATGSDAVGESDDASRARLGAAFADALLLDQTFRPSRKAAELGWTPLGPTLVDDLGTGSYSQHG